MDVEGFSGDALPIHFIKELDFILGSRWLDREGVFVDHHSVTFGVDLVVKVVASEVEVRDLELYRSALDSIYGRSEGVLSAVGLHLSLVYEVVHYGHLLD